MASSSKSVYIIAPRSEVPYSFGAEVFEHHGFAPVQWVADLAILTLAALVPDDFDVDICDEAHTPVDFDVAADYICVTGKISQSSRMRKIADEFRRRGKTVLIGGPYASLSPNSVRDSCDILVHGEVEEIASNLFSDLRSGHWKSEYFGGRPDLALSPIPRWDMYPNERTVTVAIQTSRGCPFECEFCDVIQYLGRKQRHKPVERILDELDVVYSHGYRDVFLTDDNFTVYRRRAKEVLDALRHWNERADNGPVRFVTQVSIDVAKDEELMRMCAESNLTTVFVGLETPNEASLREAKKRQNLLADPIEQVRKLVNHGVHVMSGMVVGFDNDAPDIFERQFEFAMSSPIPIFFLGALTAPEATPLYDRMEQTGRLIPNGNETSLVPWSTNIVPISMSQEQMSVGMQWLANRLFEPSFFGERVVSFIDNFHREPVKSVGRLEAPSWNGLELDMRALIGRLCNSGPGEKQMARRIGAALRKKPSAGPAVHSILLHYAQTRHLYDVGGYWDPAFARLSAPPL